MTSPFRSTATLGLTSLSAAPLLSGCVSGTTAPTAEVSAAAFAYRSMGARPTQGSWDYVQEGLSTLQLNPGERFAPLFTLDGTPATP